MLQIKKVKSYKKPRYPQGLYYDLPDNPPWNMAASGITTAMLLALMGCVDVNNRPGQVGPPPMPPKTITESEARPIINKIFMNNGVKLDADVPLTLIRDDNSTININLDGYNKQLKIGYEYIDYRTDDNKNDYGLLPDALKLLDKAAQNTDIKGAQVYTTPAMQYFDESAKAKSIQELENNVQQFINMLRKQGIL